MIDNITVINNVMDLKVKLSTSNKDFVLAQNGVNWGSVDSNHTSYKYTGQVGVCVVNSTLETRDIVITGWVTAKTKELLVERKRFLNRLINPLHSMSVEYSKFKINFLPTNSIKYGKTYGENNDVFCKFIIEGFSNDPLFFDKDGTLVSAGLINSMFTFPCHIEKDKGMVFGIREEYIIMSVPNHGDVPTGFKVVLEASKGDVTNPAIYDVNTQEFIKINKQMVKGEQIIINTFDGEKFITGKVKSDSPEENYYRYKDLDSTWLKAKVGDNLFKYDADLNVTNLSVRIYFHNRYLEVE